MCFQERLYNEETDLVLTENAAVLQAVWSAFRCRPDGGGLRTKGLSMRGFLEFMDKAHLYDEMFGYQVRDTASCCDDAKSAACQRWAMRAWCSFDKPNAFAGGAPGVPLESHAQLGRGGRLGQIHQPDVHRLHGGESVCCVRR